MAKRHTMRPGDWESIFGRLQELVLANSGEDDFEEIFKLVVGKLFSEIFAGNVSEFRLYSSTQETARVINNLIARASETWKGVFQGSPHSKLTPEHLEICVEPMQNYSFLETNFEVLDGAFEYLVNKMAKGSKGQYFTPRHVIECCVRIINPSQFDVVVDPACGSGGFLIHTLNHIRRYSHNLLINDYCKNNLWGFDFDRRVIQVAKALMLIAGDGSGNLFQLNSLLVPEAYPSLFQVNGNNGIPRITIEDVVRTRLKKFKGFDVVITNPPFAGEIREHHLLDNYEVSRKGRRVERDVLFLERCIRLLKPGGRLAIVLPTNKLGSPAWTYLREWLIRRLRIVALIGLARNTFLPHTHQKAGILFGIKRQHVARKLPSEDILFLINEESGKDSKGQIISQPGTEPWDPIWDRAKHDLSALVDQFKIFIKDSKIVWGEF